MINIEVIDSSNMGVFGRRLQTFLNEHPDAEILFTALKGIEGGKGIFCILSYEKKEPKPLPKVDTKAKEKMEAVAKAEKKALELAEKKRVAEEKATAKLEAAALKAEEEAIEKAEKKAILEAQIAQLEE